MQSCRCNWFKVSLQWSPRDMLEDNPFIVVVLYESYKKHTLIFLFSETIEDWVFYFPYMSWYFNRAELFLEDLFWYVRLTKSLSFDFSSCNEYMVYVRGRDDRVAVCLPHLHVVQPNTIFLSFLPLKWQTGGGRGAAVDESPGMWTFKRDCADVLWVLFALLSDVCQPFLCLCD